MTPEEPAAFGPYAFTLEPAEVDAVAARYGLRRALGGALTASHHAPLAAFALALLFAAILGKTDLISRRTAEIAVLVAALAFMIQRLVTHRKIWRARTKARAEVEQRLAGRAITLTIDRSAVRESGCDVHREAAFADCRDAEAAGGLVYVWGREGAPFVAPVRALTEGEEKTIVAWVRERIRRAQRPGGRQSGRAALAGDGPPAASADR